MDAAVERTGMYLQRVPKACGGKLPHALVTTAKYDWIIVPPQRTWEHFSHQADIGIRGTGATLSEAFEQAACALTAVITDPDGVRATRAVEIRCEAQDPELLLVDWLNAIVYEMAVQHLLFSRFEVRTDGHRLSGCAWGEAIDIPRHQPAVEVKGATLTELKVAQDDGGRWIAQCIVDV